MKHLSLLFFTFILAACGSDISSGSQGVGQQCFFPSDCSTGLSCYNRVCAPIGGGVINRPDAGTDTGVRRDTAPPPDMFDCNEGQTRCLDDQVLLFCQNGRFQDKQCSGFCLDGACVDNNRPCDDADGDSYGIGCELGPDCDDGDARVNPGRREACNTPFDDNCNGQANENCGSECCEDGCGDSQFCNNSCECVNVDPKVCAYQEQPCSEEGSFDNGFFCTALNENAPLRCYGLCDRTSPDPDGTCPESGSVCSFGDDNQGVCLTSCNSDTGCNAPDIGCLKFGNGPDEGICTPINPQKMLGDRCDTDTFFDCGENNYCIDLGQNGNGRCVESCRPFAYGPGGNSDCSQGHCLPLSAEIGYCAEDNGSNADERCRNQNTTCNEDAVGCYQGRCQRVCRLNVSSDDCPQGDSCRDFGGQNGFGVCQRGN